MTRRDFIKWLIATVGVIASVFTLGNWLKQDKQIKSVETDSAAALPEETQNPTSTATPMATPNDGKLLLSLFLLSDMHISFYEDTTSLKLKQALNDITINFKSSVDAIVFGGDLTDYGRELEYKQLKSILKNYKLPPLYGNMGNHEYYDVWIDEAGTFNREMMPNGKTDRMARERFQKFIGNPDTPYRDLWLNGVHLILLSQEAYQQEKKEVGEGAWYSDAQLDWLKTMMAVHQDGRPALIFIHQPLPAQGKEGGTHQLIRAEEFRSLMKPYKNVFVFSGHTHRNFNEEGHYVKETFHWITNASVGRTRQVGAGYGASQPNSFAQGCSIQVYENKVVVRGREFSDRSWISKANWSFPI
jgi:predicted MPP superfamily phosphohydrolase